MKITDANKASADEAAPVEAVQLTAEEWFERGYVFQEDKNLEEAFRCYSVATRLDPNLDAAYNNLGTLLGDLKRYEEAEDSLIAKPSNSIRRTTPPTTTWGIC